MAENQIGAGYMVGFDMGTSGLKFVAVVDPEAGEVDKTEFICIRRFCRCRL